jgi:tetratricopeptide (TPR) repeat protein
MRKRSMFALLLIALALPSLAHAQAYGAEDHAGHQEGKVAITTDSDDARALFLRARNLAEKLHAADARPIYREAIAADPNFALAYFGLANAAGSNDEFFENLEKAVSLVDRASEGERLMITGLDTGVKGNPEKQLELYKELVGSFPRDERAHQLLAGLYFGRQDYEAAIKHYSHATEINPEFSPAYNLLGYANRSLGNYEAAEVAFQKYIEVLPDEPNPHDSYAELLMKMGRFEESIEQYKKALEADPSFQFSYAGIANNQMFLGDTDAARETLHEMYEVAETDGIRRQALLWMAASHMYDGDRSAAMEVMHKRFEIAEANDDHLAMSNDYNLMGRVLLDTGNADEASALFQKAVDEVAYADIPEEVKEATRRNHHYTAALIGLATKDLQSAKTHARTYHESVQLHQVPFEIRQDHELLGRIALIEGDNEGALEHFSHANQQDPRVLYAMAEAYEGQGDQVASEEMAEQAANFNQLNFALSYVRDDARRMVAQADE